VISEVISKLFRFSTMISLLQKLYFLFVTFCNFFDVFVMRKHYH